ncbi:SDR family NAD(P)-dependent oxidoreductase, partial [Streptomyces sp. NPDC059556]
MDLGLADRTIVVTGGSSGVGLATVRALLDEGARVATCGRDADRLAKAAARLGAGRDRLLTGVCDVRDADAVDRFVRAAADT